MKELDRSDSEIYRGEEEKEIDIMEIVRKLWSRKKTIGIWTLCGAILGLIIAFSIPREYTTTVKLVPEIGEQAKQGGLNSMSAILGISGSTTGLSMSEVLSPVIYPDVAQSTPFNLKLMDVPVKGKDGNPTTIEHFILEDTSSPWWSAILGLPGKMIGVFSGDKKNNSAILEDGLIKLTKQQQDVVKALKERININVDNKTGIITLDVTMQDPMTAAILADTVSSHLREFMTEYRTNKARNDLLYVQRLNEEAREEYYRMQQKYADYLDRNQGLILHSAQTERERLQNETTLAFNVYNQTSIQLKQAQAKVQANKPIFTIVEPATVPLKPSKPRKALILLGCAFMGFLAACGWILFGDTVKSIKNPPTEEAA